MPENATLALVGDFDPAAALQLVSQYLGRVPKSDRPVPRDVPAEPEQRQERRVTLRENWPLPVVVVAYHVTYDGHPDSYPLHVASKILSDGQSSRIYRTLVYEKQVALAAFGGGNIIEDPNLFFAVAIVQPGHTPAEAEKALVGELDRLRDEPVTERELQRAKNQFARDYILGREIEPAESDPARPRRRHSQGTTSRRPTASSTSSWRSRPPTSSASPGRISRPRTGWS